MLRRRHTSETLAEKVPNIDSFSGKVKVQLAFGGLNADAETIECLLDFGQKYAVENDTEGRIGYFVPAYKTALGRALWPAAVVYFDRGANLDKGDVIFEGDIYPVEPGRAREEVIEQRRPIETAKLILQLLSS